MTARISQRLMPGNRAGVLPFLALPLLLGACVPGPSPGPQDRPPADAAPAETPESAAERAYYARTQASLLSAGLLRTDGGGMDTPFDARDLAETFLRLAFYEEYDPALGGLLRREAPTPFARWQAPLRVSLEFGAAMAGERQETLRIRVASYLARLTELTGHPVGLAPPGSANVLLFYGTVDERRALGPRIAQAMPGLSPALVGGITEMGHANFCLVYVTTDATGTVKERAVAVIPSELPDLMSLMCLHEELAQAMGLPNDSRRARPSVFNDDNEFATLTTMDEMLLRMLYDPALAPGMTEAEARPVVEALANRLISVES